MSRQAPPANLAAMLRPLILVSALAALCSCSVPTRVEHFAGPNPDLPFSKAVLVGDTLYVAGHLGLDPKTGRAPADPEVEADLMLDAFAATLAQAGLTMDHLVHVQVFCSDIGLYGAFNQAYSARFTGDFPARAFIGAGVLLRGARFEIVGTAVKNAKR